MGRACVVEACKQEYYPGCGLSFHRFPKEPGLKEKWVKCTKRENWFPSHNSVVCSRHFAEDCFYTIIQRRRLLDTAIPTLHIPLVGTEKPRTLHAVNKHDLDEDTDTSTEGDIGELSSDNLNECSSHESDADSDTEAYVCYECNKPIKGGRFACAQCVDYDLCTQCAGERAAHRQHYLLRVPPRRPPDEVERVLQTIRSMLDIDGATVASPANGSKNKQTEKMEIKQEIEIHEEPLSYGIKQEIKEEEDNYMIRSMLDIDGATVALPADGSKDKQAEDIITEIIKEIDICEESLSYSIKQEIQEEDYCEALKRVIPVTVDIERAAKRRKQETHDVRSVPPGPLQLSLVKGATAIADSAMPSVVKQEHEPSPRTLTASPSMRPPLAPPMLAVSSALVPGAGGAGGGARAPAPAVPALTRSLVIENMQIRVASDQFDESEDVQRDQTRHGGSTQGKAGNFVHI